MKKTAFGALGVGTK